MTVSQFARAARRARLQSSLHPARLVPGRRLGLFLERQASPAVTTGSRLPKFISTTAARRLLVPDGQPKKPVETPQAVPTPANITDEDYHRVADLYLDQLVERLEKMQDKREDVEVEYSSGVLSVTFSLTDETYVINKQPPNKQIWLSSPKTGPKRYDYVVYGDGQGDKQDTAQGDWVYLRDNSSIGQLLVEELGIDLRMPDSPHDA